MHEETGLTIKNPKLMGIYHWISGDVRNVGFYTGQMSLKANLFHQMKERVYWISEKRLSKKSLAPVCNRYGR